MNEEIRSIGSLLVARAWLFQLFRKTIGAQPTEGLVAYLNHPATLAALDEYCDGEGAHADTLRGFASACRNLTSQDVEGLKRSFNKLVAGVGKPAVALWESAWAADSDGALFSLKTLAVREAFRSHGYRAQKYNSMPEDGLGMMLEFMAQMAKQDYRELACGNVSNVATRLAEEASFYTQHILGWLPRAAERAGAKLPQGDFYALVLEALRSLLELDRIFASNVLAWFEEQDGVAEVGLGPEGEAFEGFMAMLAEMEALDQPFLSDSMLVRVC